MKLQIKNLHSTKIEINIIFNYRNRTNSSNFKVKAIYLKVYILLSGAKSVRFRGHHEHHIYEINF
ncbi:hypothetical protein C2G38_2070614 [Gigaspora rosea]|uniref:Uncharacterized protein n=1 Tax=Gigaspora rosea TaxID=44941 RepID=A0A397VNP0_9GLOM|nr:hypothetical protein C2G38_2070614 [Gigaspora rosea]